MRPINLGLPKGQRSSRQPIGVELIETTLLAARPRVQYQDFHTESQALGGSIPEPLSERRHEERCIFVICHLSFVILDRSQISKDLGVIQVRFLAGNAGLRSCMRDYLVPEAAARADQT